MTANLKQTADAIEKRIRRYMPGFALNFLRSDENINELRDECDSMTGGDLDCTTLDILTDMVAARLTAKEAHQ